MNRPAELGRSSVRGVAWNSLTYGLGKLLVFVTTIILARLLVPQDFGLVAIGLVVIGYLEWVNDFGVKAAVIQRRDDSDHTANVAFWINMAIGIALTLIGVVSAPWLAALFGDERATPIIRVLSLSFVITSIGAIHAARVQRELDFKRRVIPETAKSLAKGAVSITLAIAGFGAWSLVWGQLAGALTASVLYWVVFHWLPRWSYDRATARRILGFGSQMTLVGFLGGLNKNIDYLLVSRRLGTRELGVYTIAFRMPQLLIESVVSITGNVAFPAFAKVQDDLARLQRGLVKMLTATAVVLMPLGVGLALVSDPFVRVFYGTKWVDAIPVMQLLAVYMLVQSISKPCGDLYKAMGRLSILNTLNIIKLLITVPALLIAVPHGIVAVALAQIVAATILTAVRFVIAAHVLEMSVGAVLRSLLPALRAGTAMTVACLLVLAALSDAPSLVVLLAVTACGAIVYCGAVLAFDRPVAREIRGLLRSRRERRPDPATIDEVDAASGEW